MQLQTEGPLEVSKDPPFKSYKKIDGPRSDRFHSLTMDGCNDGSTKTFENGNEGFLKRKNQSKSVLICRTCYIEQEQANSPILILCKIEIFTEAPESEILIFFSIYAWKN